MIRRSFLATLGLATVLFLPKKSKSSTTCERGMESPREKAKQNKIHIYEQDAVIFTANRQVTVEEAQKLMRGAYMHRDGLVWRFSVKVVDVYCTPIEGSQWRGVAYLG